MGLIPPAFERIPGRAGLNPQEGMANLGLSGCPMGAIWAGNVPSPPGFRGGGGLPAAAPNAAGCLPAGHGLWMGHFLDSESTWQVAASSRPARPASRTRVSRPQAEPHAFPLCKQGPQLPQGPSSHSSVGWRHRQTIWISWQGDPGAKSGRSRSLKTTALTRSRGETLDYLFMRAWDGRHTKAHLGQKWK